MDRVKHTGFDKPRFRYAPSRLRLLSIALKPICERMRFDLSAHLLAWSTTGVISLLAALIFLPWLLRNRQSRQLTQSIDLLRQAFRDTLRAQPFQIDVIVILPDHLHAIWTLPPGDSNYPARWKAVKSNFSRLPVKSGIPVEKRQDGSMLVWQRRYWEHTIRDHNDLSRHIDYIHFNPVKHGLVSHVADWPFSSFHRYVKLGFLPLDWASETMCDSVGGEPAYRD
jgi:putative transposase